MPAGCSRTAICRCCTNQWADVVRWELQPRLLLRTSEFLRPEGHPKRRRRGTETLSILQDVFADTIVYVRSRGARIHEAASAPALDSPRMSTNDDSAGAWRSIVRTVGPAVMNSRMGVFAQRRAPELFHPQPRTTLGPERLYAYFDALWRRRKLDGSVVEVGCYLGGTAALAFQLLRDTSHEKRYVCIDTFGGFVPEQFAHDVRTHGLTSSERRGFSGSSKKMVERLLKLYGCDAVELIEADIVSLSVSSLPDAIAVALVDVELEIPVYEALEKLHPRLVSGGMILVDDCSVSSHFPGARSGYERFLRAHDLQPRFEFNMGIVERNDPGH
jgi:O-methyltransferase